MESSWQNKTQKSKSIIKMQNEDIRLDVSFKKLK